VIPTPHGLQHGQNGLAVRIIAIEASPRLVT